MQTNSHVNNALEAKLFTKGTIKLPASLRRELGVHDGEKVLFMKKNGAWIVTTHLRNIRESQEYIESMRLDNKSVVDSLIRDRREEAKIEFADDMK